MTINLPVRTRFAPSPTGYLHLGGARTALFCWLFAKANNGTFILRIEDTDRERSTPEAVQGILDGMTWLGLQPDEGPFYQFQRLERYQEVLELLFAKGRAYRCYCSQSRLEALRADQLEKKHKPRYDGHCRDLDLAADPDKPYVIRFKNPSVGEVKFKDAILGEMVFANSELDDLVIARSDGTPTYNFAVVVDDWDMEITHVIRGNDHLNNTPRQLNILAALDANALIPIYAHLPMINGSDGKKLSKRHGAVNVMAYQEAGYLPEALLNYLVRLGWSQGDQEIFTKEEMISHFNLSGINKSAASFDFNKLDWLNQHYLKTSSPQQIAPALQWQMDHLNIPTHQGPDLTALIPIQANRCKTLRELALNSRCFYESTITYQEAAANQHLTSTHLPALQYIQQNLNQLSDWQLDNLQALIKETLVKFQLKMPQVAQPLRVMLTGDTSSPSIDKTMILMGKEKTQARIAQGIHFIENNSH